MKQTRELRRGRRQKRKNSRLRLIQGDHRTSIVRSILVVVCGLATLLLAMAAVGDAAPGTHPSPLVRVAFVVGALIAAAFTWFLGTRRGIRFIIYH